MKRRIVSILCCLALIFTLLPVSAFASGATTVTFGGKEYDLIQGYHYSSSNQGSPANFDAYLPFFYSDGYFEEDPAIENEHLATMSLNLAISSIYSIPGVKDIFRHGPARQLLSDIGCDEEKIFVNDAYLVPGETDSIGFMIGQKELAYHGGEKTGYTLVTIVPRSAGYGMEWISNFTVGSTGESKGFADSADEVMAGVEAYLEKYDLADDAAERKVKFWAAGYSRGAAVANLLGKRLVDAYGTDFVYCYTWETPIGGAGEENRHGNTGKYDGIHNYMNYADIVTLVAPEWLGLFRYGQDHFYPSADAAEYETQKAAMLKQFAQIDPTYEFTDAFSLAYITISLDITLSNIKDVLAVIDGGDFLGTIDYTHTDSVNHFAGDYMRKLVSRLRAWSIADRSTFNQSVTLNGNTYIPMQKALLIAMTFYFGTSDYILKQMIERIEDYFGGMSTSAYIDLFTDVKEMLECWVAKYDPHLLEWNKLKDSERVNYINKYWNMIEASGALDADLITAEQKAELKEAWPTAVCMLMPFLCADYNEKAKDYSDYSTSETTVMTASLINNIDIIPINHIHGVALAWARSYDSYYNDVPAYQESIFSSVDAPTATASLLPLSVSSLAPASVGLYDTIKLDVPYRSGETMIYTLTNLTTSTTVAENVLYTDGVRLPEDANVGDDYSLSVTAWSYGHDNSNTFYFTTAPAVSAAEITDSGISYRACGDTSDHSVQVIAAAYDNGRLVDSAVSDVLTGPGTLTGTLPLDTDDGYTYRLFLVVGNTAKPVCPCWRSDAAS